MIFTCQKAPGLKSVCTAVQWKQTRGEGAEGYSVLCPISSFTNAALFQTMTTQQHRLGELDKYTTAY